VTSGWGGMVPVRFRAHVKQTGLPFLLTISTNRINQSVGKRVVSGLGLSARL